MKYILGILLVVCSINSHSQIPKEYDSLVKQAAFIEKEVNKKFTALLTKTTAVERKLLTAEHSAWLRHRQTELDIVRHQSRGGSMTDIIVLEKKVALTEQRLAKLQEYSDYWK